MAAIGDQVFEQIAKQRSELNSGQLAGEPRAHPQAQPFGVERFEHFCRQLRAAAHEARAFAAFAVDQELARVRRYIRPPHPPRDDRGGEEVGAKELRHGVRNPIFLARNDRGVGDRHAQRMAEQRGHREPVGQPANHSRFRKGVQVAPERMYIEVDLRHHEHARHGEKQAGGGAADLPGLVQRRSYNQPVVSHSLIHRRGDEPISVLV